MRVQLGIAVCLIWVVALAVAEDESELQELDADFVDDVEEKPIVALKKNGATARTWDWAKKMAKWMGYDYEYEEEYYDYYYPVQYVSPDGQFAPTSQVGAGGSSYVSYQQHHPGAFHHSPARDDYYVTDDDDWSYTDMMFDVAVAIVPLGLILAALPSGLFTFAVRRRSFGDNLLDDSFDPEEMPILKDLLENDWLSFTARECQERLFCEISQLGEREESSFMQKFFYYATSLTPDFVARKAGLDDVFRASRYGQCEIFRCGPTAPDAFAPVSNDIAPITNNNTEADLTEPSKE